MASTTSSGGPNRPSARTGRLDPSITARLAGFLRLVHPFPSLLDALVTAILAALAGADVPLAARLGVAMFALQASIGATNDVLDAGRDTGFKTSKPIPGGLVSARAGGVLAAGSAVAGLGLSALSGPFALLVALAGLGVGMAYNLWLKSTAWSWLPFAVGIPLLPVYAWIGAVGRLPSAFAVLVPTAVIAASALALANALADLERDEAVGRSTAATKLGRRTASRLGLILEIVVVVVAAGTAARPRTLPTALIAMLVAGGIVLLGALLSARESQGLRERAWELQAIGVAALALMWVGTVRSAGGL